MRELNVAGNKSGDDLSDLFANMSDEERQQALQQLMQLGVLGGQQPILGQQQHQLAQQQMFQPRAYGWGAGLASGISNAISGYQQHKLMKEQLAGQSQMGDLRAKLYDLLYGRRGPNQVDQAWQGINAAGGLPGEGTGI